MDADKDKQHVPEDSDPKTENNDHKDSKKNDVKNDDNNKDEQHPEKPDNNQDHSPGDQDHDHQVDDHSSPKPSSADNNNIADPPNSETPPADAAIKDQEEQDPADDGEIKPEEDQSSPPPPLNLEKISEEIDQYILTFSAIDSSTPPQADQKSTTITTPPQADDEPTTITTPPQDDDESTTITTPPKDDESTTISSTQPQDDDDDHVDGPPSFVEQFVFMVEAKIADYDSIDPPVKWSRLTEEDSASFIEAIIRLSSLSRSLPREPKYAHSHNRIGGVLQRAMSYLEEEFKSLVEDYKIHDSDNSNNPTNTNPNEIITKPNQESDDLQSPAPPESPAPAAPEDNQFPGYTDEILSDLVKLSKTLMAGGHETECCQVYFVTRRNALEHSLHKLGFEKYSIDEVQKMQWESLAREIDAWIRAFKQCAEVHLSSERQLSKAVFSDHPSIADSIFCSLSQCMIIQLLNFAGAVALTKRAVEKMFKFLDVYESLRNTIPTINNFFPEEWMNEVGTEASMIRGRMGEAIIAIFVELENSIKADANKTPVPGGAIHPLTRYTMNYLKNACDDYKETLEQVFREHQKIERADSANGSDFNYNNHMNHQSAAAVQNHSPFQNQMTKVMDLLDAYLEARSNLYKDHSLSSIFMMNNGRYILQKIKASTEINSLMGDSWCRKRSTDLRQYHKGYQRETWGKLLSCLNPEGLMSNGKIVKPVVKERFKSFNTMFDEIHKTQSNWVVSDEQLQSELRVSISNMVIPAYRSFLGRYGQVFTPGRQTEKYVKYQADDIETLIDELFDGNAAPPTGRKKQ